MRQPRERVRGERRDDERIRILQVRVRICRRRPARERPERLGGDEPLRSAREHRRHVVTRADEQPDELARLVGGDPTRHADDDVRHVHIVQVTKSLAAPASAYWPSYANVSLPREISSIAIVR